MLAFVRRYASHPETEWAPLFHTVLQSRIEDARRRASVRGRWRVWLRPRRESDDEGDDPLQGLADPAPLDPARLVADDEFAHALDAALRALPLRQQQCFLLRSWEGLDVADTARAMGCSEGSVKTHYSRAVAALRARLAAHGA